MLKNRRGLTLTEVLVAATLGVVVIMGIGLVDVGRFRMGEDLRQRTGISAGQGDVALAAMHLTKNLERADRINLTAASGIQIRVPSLQGACAVGIPASACFDDPNNFRWDQYRLTAGQVRYYSDTGAGCGTLRVLTTQVTAMTFAYVNDYAGAPPGGEPPVQDNNAVSYSLTWDNGLAGPQNRTQIFSGQAVARAVPYSNVNAAAPGDSGSGLSTGGLPNPPALCP